MSLSIDYVRSKLGNPSFLGGRAGARRLCAKLEVSADAKSAPARWYPFAAIQQLWMFEGLLDESAELAVIAAQEFASDTPPRGGGFAFEDETYPIDDALLCPALKGGSAGQRLAEARVHVRPESVLGKRLTWLQANIHAIPTPRLVSGYSGWEDAPVPVGSAYTSLVRDITTAAASDAQKLWTAAYEAKDVDLGARIFAKFGLVTPFWYVAAWYAGWQIAWGDVGGAQTSMLIGLEIPMPFSEWDLFIPYDAVLQPQLRPAMTEAFRDEVLTRRGLTLPWQ